MKTDLFEEAYNQDHLLWDLFSKTRLSIGVDLDLRTPTLAAARNSSRNLCPYWLVVPLMERFPWVRQYQLVQEQPDLVRLLVVAAPEVTDAPEKLSGWRRDAEEDCGGSVRVVVEQVAQIPLEPSGKFHSIRSRLHRPVDGPTP